MRFSESFRPAHVIAFLCVLFFCSCLSGDRLAGGSTEAGNAGGKLSLSDGSPAGEVAVTLVARSYLPDTLDAAPGDVPGSYYRTRTGPDGRFSIKGVVPGRYRVMAVGGGKGAMAESVLVEAGGETAFIEKVMKPLGGIRGVARLVGSQAKPRLFVRPKATVRKPPVADALGDFRLDSLPEGEYELVPSCLSCQPSRRSYLVSVTAGLDIIMEDTLDLYPEYFQAFPAAGELVVRSGILPFRVAGKVGRGEEAGVHPVSVAWTWNGASIVSREVAADKGFSETSVLLDSAIFAGAGEGTLRLELAFQDTVVSRQWQVKLDTSGTIWPLAVVAADNAEKVPGPVDTHIWRIRITDKRTLSPFDLAFWGIDPGALDPDPVSLPAWVELAVDPNDEAILEGSGPERLTFVLIPDIHLGGRVFRPRRDERIEDFAKIRYLENAPYLERAHLGLDDTLIPTLLPEGLLLDRSRGKGVSQRYRVDSSGAVRELLGALPMTDPPLLFYRFGPAGSGFSWNAPIQGAATALAVTWEGLAMRLDSSGEASRMLPESEIAALMELMAPMSAVPAAFPDTQSLTGNGSLAYLHFGSRGVFHASGSLGALASLLLEFDAWMIRNGLVEGAGYPLEAGVSRYLAFAEDSSGVLRFTGDTLIAEGSRDSNGLGIREYLTKGSPSRTSGDTAVLVYRLTREGDSLIARAAPLPVTSRLFGKIDGHLAVFALAGLPFVAPGFHLGLPVLGQGESMLAGRLQTEVRVQGRVLESPRFFLDGRSNSGGIQGSGFLYTPEGGLERSWKFGGRTGLVKGWDREQI